MGPGAALQEQDLVVVRNAEQVAEICLGFLDDAVKNLAAVAHFHNGHAASFIIEHLVGSFAKDFFGKHCGACGKIVNSVHFLFTHPVSVISYYASGR